jgi:alpha-soluble NSF attachment protein
MSESEARELLAKADKKLKGLGIFGNKYEDAADLLSQAANNFKLAKACE